MSHIYKYTYAYGYRLKANKIICKKDFHNLCNDLTKEFNEFYKTNVYGFKPEAITEGGIVFTNFYDQQKTGYKSMRLHTITKVGTYGMITDNVMEEWKNNEEILCKEGCILGTSLKSLGGASVWTYDELKIFEKCFNKIGISCSQYPEEKALCFTFDFKQYLNQDDDFN